MALLTVKEHLTREIAHLIERHDQAMVEEHHAQREHKEQSDLDAAAPDPATPVTAATLTQTYLARHYMLANVARARERWADLEVRLMQACRELRAELHREQAAAVEPAKQAEDIQPTPTPDSPA